MFYGATSAPSIAAGGYYTTSFSGTEDPLSETGIWTCGATVGLDWHDPKKTPGIAFGKQGTGTPPPYDDSLAHLSGFAANHYATGVVHNASATGQLEVELLLRFAITAHSATGYEIDITTGLVALVRWNGALNDFTALVPSSGDGHFSAANGAVWYAEIVGTIITVKCNGFTQLTYDTASDTPKYSSGNPGLGFYRAGTTSSPDTFGWSSYTASNI